ncbi:MAG: phosphoribosyltransferase family protein [Planctomycetota bacterium]
MINYRNVPALNRDVWAWLQKLPKDIELIVGIPRSGLLVANLLSLYMDIPLTDVDGLLEGRVIQTGPRYKRNDPRGLLSSRRTVLVVDDSVWSGKQMAAVKRMVESAELRHRILYGAVYVKPGSQDVVDYFFEMLQTPRFFEWNVFHRGGMEGFCVDIDGVLCRDPTPEENDDGERYKRFIRTVEPWIIPSKTVGWLVTCRLEKYRSLTEEWLAEHGFKYQHLIMMDLPDKAARLRSQSHAKYKAQVYKTTGARFFIESSQRQAMEIAIRTGKDVLCMETGNIVSPSFLNRNYHGLLRFGRLFLEHPKEALRILRRRFYLSTKI